MYVWDNGFDPYIDGCDEKAFLDSDHHPECYSHNWNTPEKRQYLWKSCNIEGREISSIFLSGIPGLKYAKENNDCNTDEIKMVRETLHEFWPRNLNTLGCMHWRYSYAAGTIST